LGTLEFERGWFAYVGSARGPGGVKARVGRHLSKEKRAKWHIDHLTRWASVAEVWICEGKATLEHEFAKILAEMAGKGRGISGFGSSDCNCKTHLFRFGAVPDIDEFRRRARKADASPVERHEANSKWKDEEGRGSPCNE